MQRRWIKKKKDEKEKGEKDLVQKKRGRRSPRDRHGKNMKAG